MDCWILGGEGSGDRDCVFVVMLPDHCAWHPAPRLARYMRADLNGTGLSLAIFLPLAR